MGEGASGGVSEVRVEWGVDVQAMDVQAMDVHDAHG
jgi:hypothetical protein